MTVAGQSGGQRRSRPSDEDSHGEGRRPAAARARVGQRRRALWSSLSMHGGDRSRQERSRVYTRVYIEAAAVGSAASPQESCHAAAGPLLTCIKHAWTEV
jgi:hypothetical protein